MPSWVFLSTLFCLGTTVLPEAVSLRWEAGLVSPAGTSLRTGPVTAQATTSVASTPRSVRRPACLSSQQSRSFITASRGRSGGDGGVGGCAMHHSLSRGLATPTEKPRPLHFCISRVRRAVSTKMCLTRPGSHGIHRWAWREGPPVQHRVFPSTCKAELSYCSGQPRLPLEYSTVFSREVLNQSFVVFQRISSCYKWHSFKSLVIEMM